MTQGMSGDDLGNCEADDEREPLAEELTPVGDEDGDDLRGAASF